MAAPHIFTRQEIVTLLRGDPRAVERGILALYERQLEDERSASTARARNRSGFSLATAPHGTMLAQELLAGRHLNGPALKRALEITEFHAGQLARIATEMDANRVKAREDERKEMHRRLYNDLVRDVERAVGRQIDRTRFNEVVRRRAQANGDTSPEGMIGAGQEVLEDILEGKPIR